MENELEKPRKRIFIALLSLSLLCIAMVAFAFWRLCYLGLSEISSYLPLVIGTLLTAGFVVTGLGIVSMVGAIIGVPGLSFFQRQTYALINLLFPIAILLEIPLFSLKHRMKLQFISPQIINGLHPLFPRSLQLGYCK